MTCCCRPDHAAVRRPWRSATSSMGETSGVRTYNHATVSLITDLWPVVHYNLPRLFVTHRSLSTAACVPLSCCSPISNIPISEADDDHCPGRGENYGSAMFLIETWNHYEAGAEVHCKNNKRSRRLAFLSARAFSVPPSNIVDFYMSDRKRYWFKFNWEGATSVHKATAWAQRLIVHRTFVLRLNS